MQAKAKAVFGRYEMDMHVQFFLSIQERCLGRRMYVDSNEFPQKPRGITLEKDIVKKSF